MTKVWIVSAVVVAALVGGVILLTSDPTPEANGNDTPEYKAPASLSEAEVRTYMKVRVREHRILSAVAKSFGGPNRIDGRAAMQKMLREHQMTQADWGRLRNRVEFVVGILRYEGNAEQRRGRIEQEIRKKEVILEDAKSEQLKAKVKEDIAMLKAKLDAVARPITDSDRELVNKFRKTLFELAPGDAPPDTSGDAERK